MYTIKKNVGHLHIRKECDESRNQFKEQLVQCFDKDATQYIANFEGMKSNLDNNLDNEELNKMEALIIDVFSPLSASLNNENSKVFFTL